MNTLLTRTEFREAVFARDGGKCVFCDKPAVDAHHIMERRLWPDGGYYLNNGASVCEEHHLACETTCITTEQVREACGIEEVILPPHLYSDQIYDKWGNIYLNKNQRMRGELFFDESVQKSLADGGWLHTFTYLVKYPRTYHLPWSPGMGKDDRMMQSIDAFRNRDVIVTEKMDGENTTLYNDNIHARSVDSRHHDSQSWVKGFWSKFAHDIPEKWRVCGENLYAKHSIKYTDLNSYFMGFSIWNERNLCLSWNDTLEWFSLLGILPVTPLYNGPFNEQIIREIWDKSMDHNRSEGYVMRVADSFSLREFRSCVGKFVRKGHIDDPERHWRYGRRMEQNKLKNCEP